MAALWELPATAPAVVTTCKHCGSDKGFREHGSVTAPASRVTRRIDTVNGKAKPRWDSVDVETWGADDGLEVDYVDCRNCGAVGDDVDELLGAPPTFEPGDRVFCPDGLKGVVSTVDEDSCTLTIHDWHETFRFGDVGRMTT